MFHLGTLHIGNHRSVLSLQVKHSWRMLSNTVVRGVSRLLESEPLQQDTVMSLLP